MKKLKYVKRKDILAIFKFLIVLPVALIAKIFIHNFWIVSESEYEARDNGYWFFKYVKENKPQQKIAYVINKKSADYLKVKDLGKVINYGGFSHWFWYLVASKIIISQKGDGKPSAAVCYFLEVSIPVMRNNRYFLQHGITKDDAEWLYYKNCKFKMFICGAKPEYEFIKEKFGYPEGAVKYLGFSRFDALHNNETDKKTILVMPSWREWLAMDIKDEKSFKETEYALKWNELLNSKKLKDTLEKNDKKLIFYPHRNMQKFIACFKTDIERVEIIDSAKMDICEALKNSALMITDYSSVFFDFAYMKKPVLFYQFDEKEFRARQYKEGYFNYHKNSLGKFTDNLDDLLSSLEALIANNFACSDNIEEFFELYDDKNSERIYSAISEN